MKQTMRFLAADLGASSGRVMLGQWNGRQFSLEEVHRFSNGGVYAENTLYWDVLGLWARIQEAMIKFRVLYNCSPDGIGVDAWGVDFGLLDKCGRLIANPVHYRDKRTDGIPDRFFKSIPEQELFVETGTQTMAINTLYQLYSMVTRHDDQLCRADKLLMMPDLFLYFLSREISAEFTEASTTQMYSLSQRGWSSKILSQAGIPRALLPEIGQPGETIGMVSRTVLEHCGLGEDVPVIRVASHDTASAVAAIPEMDAESVFISSGTWSMIGVEVTEPITSDEALRLRFTNEGAGDGGVLLMKNLAGLWTLQECMQHWRLSGKQLHWNDIINAATEADNFWSTFDPNDPRLGDPGDMPTKIQAYCRATNQQVPTTIGEITRCALQSLSLKYRSAIEALQRITGRQIKTIRIVGGGSLNSLLCQMTADACNRVVIAGPAEASALGNVMLQAVATGQIANLQEGRKAIAESFHSTRFEPRRRDEGDAAFARFKNVEFN
jgi:rhamnulokinase